MGRRIIKGYWKCEQCDTVDIDGLVDICPNCGKRKSETVKYYMKKDMIEEVSDNDLKKAGITKTECDGKHKEWICNYCNQLNNWADTTCNACGAPKEDATHEYDKQEFSEGEFSKGIFSERKFSAKKLHTYQKDYQEYIPNIYSIETTETIDESIYNETSETIVEKENKRTFHFPFPLLGKIVSVLAGILFILFLFWPIKEEVTVTGFSWNRTITIEKERTVKEEDWSVPYGARIYDEKWEFKT